MEYCIKFSRSLALIALDGLDGRIDNRLDVDKAIRRSFEGTVEGPIVISFKSGEELHNRRSELGRGQLYEFDVALKERTDDVESDITRCSDTETDVVVENGVLVDNQCVSTNFRNLD